MSLKDSLLRVVTQPNNTALSQNFLKAVSRYDEGVCRSLLVCMKKLLKDRNQSPVNKLETLRVGFTQLLTQCMVATNLNFLLAAQKKILNRLGIFARHKKPDQDPMRGRDIFGFSSTATPENEQASSEFLRLLLEAIRKWASQFELGPDGLESEYSKLYKTLLQENVAFPGAVSSLRSPRSSITGLDARPSPSPDQVSKRFQRDIERCTSSASLLIQLLNANDNSDLISKLVTDLQTYHPQLISEIQARSTAPTSETELQMLLQAHELISRALKLQSQQPGGVPYAPEVPQVTPQDPVKPQKEGKKQMQVIKDELTVRIERLKAEITDVRNLLFSKQTDALGNKTPEMLQKEADVRLSEVEATHRTRLEALDAQLNEGDMLLPGLVQKGYELQAVVDNLQVRITEIENYRKKDIETLKNVRLENVLLEDQLKEKTTLLHTPPLTDSPETVPDQTFFNQVPSPVLNNPFGDQGRISENGYMTERSSVSSSERQEVADPELLALLPVSNVTEFRQMCYKEQGLLFENESVQVGIQVKIQELEGKARVCIVNKTSESLEKVYVYVKEEPVTGLKVLTDNTSQVNLRSEGRIYRSFAISVYRPFSSPPDLFLSYIRSSIPVQVRLSLPIIYPLFIKPMVLPADSARANWDSLQEWESSSSFTGLHSQIQSMNKVIEVLRFNSNFLVLGGKQLPELGQATLLSFGQIRDYLACAKITIDGRTVKSGTVTVRCRNQESRNCLLKTIVDFLAA